MTRRHTHTHKHSYWINDTKLVVFIGKQWVEEQGWLGVGGLAGPFRLMHPKKPKGLGLDLFFQVFGYLGFGFGFGYFANLLQISNKIIKIKKIFLVFGYGFEYQF